MSLLDPKTSVMVGVSTAAFVGFVYSYGVPNIATIGATQAHDLNIESGRKRAAWTGAAAVAVAALLTKDKTVFVIGGATVIALDWHARHANATPPTSTKVLSQTGYGTATSEMRLADDAVEAAPAYGDSYNAA